MREISLEPERERERMTRLSPSYSTETKETVISQPPTVLHWVRMSALRIHDNPALRQALLDRQRRLRCVFIIDPWFVGGRIGENR